MTAPAPDARPSSLHRRLTVALTVAARRPQLAEALTGALADSTAGAAALRSTDLLEAAAALAAIRAGDQAELRTRLEAAAGRADEDRIAALRARDDLVSRQVRLLESAEWARSCGDELARRRGLVSEARAVVDAKAAALRTTQVALERVLEQRAAAAAAVEEADRELGEMTSAGMDEPGLRRELEVAGRSVRDQSAAVRAAADTLQDLDAERTRLLAELDAARSRAVGGSPTGLVTAAQIERVLDAYEGFRSATGREISMVSRPDPAALELSQAWQDLAADFAEATAEAGPLPSAAELQAAERELAEANTALQQLERQLEARVLTPEQRAEIEAAHVAVLEAEERSGRRIGGGAAKARLEAARAAEQALLERHGFAGYLEVTLTGGRAGTQDPALAAAERRYLAASTALERLQHASSSSTLAYLESERERLRQHTIALIGADPGDAAVELLEAHPTVPSTVVADLREALDLVGIRPVGVALMEAAEAWLGEQRAAADEHLDAAATEQEEAARLAELEARASELDALLEGARRRADEAAENLEMAQRSVDALEAELTMRAGEDTKRLKRLAAAEQLRAQVDAVEATLARAEAAARVALEDALTEHGEAEVAFEQANAAVTELARRARSLRDELPEDQRPDGDVLDALDHIAEVAAAQAAALQPEVEAAEDTLVHLTTAHGEAVEAVAMAARASDGPQRDDFLEGLAQLLERAADGTVLVLDDPFAGIEPAARDDLLAVVREGSEGRQLVLLTEDPEILGWAIELPADVGTAVPADALLARTRRPQTDLTDDRPDLTDAQPARQPRDHAGRH